MTNTNKPGIGFWIISIIALIWNAMGVMAYIGQAYMTDDMLQALPEAEQAFYANIPAWVTAAFAISVFAGLLGCIGLLVRKKWAVSLFILSFIGVIAQQVYNFFMQDYIELSGARMIMPIVVFVVCVFLIWYSKDQKAKGVLS
ncbi:hypothetical protein [Pontimicrobium sp. IMCC45349]|uniref:hypothetical protein n=1 Tax=Pontimicrobium sp. IMCC45349 TaxID=3391574 RepID=UPI0039A2BF14